MNTCIKSKLHKGKLVQGRFSYYSLQGGVTEQVPVYLFLEHWGNLPIIACSSHFPFLVLSLILEAAN